MRTLAIIITAVALLLGVGRASAQPAPPPASQEGSVDRLAGTVGELSRAVERAEAEERELRRRYNRELQAIDRLKAQRRSWRVDRQLGEQKASAQAVGRLLASADRRDRLLRGTLATARARLLDAVLRELRAPVSVARQLWLRRLRSELGQALRPPVRKITLPDETLDALADPEELAEQISLLRQAERELGRQAEILKARASRYRRWATLRENRQRSRDLEELDDDSVRRHVGAPGFPTAAVQGRSLESPAPLAGEADGATGGEGGAVGGGGAMVSAPLADASIVLADVIDGTSRTALRRAAQSEDPAAKARAAARAADQVAARLERLRRNRERIERHLRGMGSGR